MAKHNLKFSLDVSLYLILPILLLFCPFRFLVPWILAAAVHELGHILAAMILQIDISSIHISPSGARISMPQLENWQELLCAAAGPVLGSTLILTARYFPTLALCTFFQTIYNLLPLRNNDGERILKCLLKYIIPHQAEWITRSVGFLSAFLLTAICVYISRRWFVSVLLALAILRKTVKIPCKQQKLIVQ